MGVITKRDEKGRIAKGSNLRHGLSDHPVYDCWVSMRARCNNERHPMFKHYGARGIKVCDRWQGSFVLFLKDMGMKPCKASTLDRIDNDGDYEPNNCRWINIQEQQKNRSNSNIVPGVHFEKSRNKWHVDISRGGRKVFGGRYNNFDDAVNARLKLEKEYALPTNHRS